MRGHTISPPHNYPPLKQESGIDWPWAGKRAWLERASDPPLPAVFCHNVLPPTFLSASSPWLDSPPCAGFMGYVWRVSCFPAVTVNPHRMGTEGGGRALSAPLLTSPSAIPHPPSPPYCVGRTRRAKLILACMELHKGRSEPDWLVTSLEEKLYDKVWIWNIRI